MQWRAAPAGVAVRRLFRRVLWRRASPDSVRQNCSVFSVIHRTVARGCFVWVVGDCLWLAANSSDAVLPHKNARERKKKTTKNMTKLLTALGAADTPLNDQRVVQIVAEQTRPIARSIGGLQEQLAEMKQQQDSLVQMMQRLLDKPGTAKLFEK